MHSAVLHCLIDRRVIAGYWLMLLLISGCASNAYTPMTLPQQYLAHRPLSVHALDLSRLANAGVGTDMLQPGDTVEVTVATGVETGLPPKYDLRISERQMLDVPLVGPVDVAWASPTNAEERIRAAAVSRGVYIDPKVTVAVKKKQSNRITVSGAVTEPSSYEIPVASSDLLSAITMAKGFEDDADTFIEIRHPPGVGPRRVASTQDGRVVPASGNTEPITNIELDLRKIDSVPSDYLRLYDGSVVNVKRRKDRTINVMGLVNDPGTLEMPQDEPMTLLDAIGAAGSTKITLADRVQVIRRGEEGRDPVVIEASIREAKKGGRANLELAPGDIVSVEETPTTFAIETIRTFFRVGFSAAIPGL